MISFCFQKTAMKLLPFMSQDERVCGLVKNLHTSYVQKDTYNATKAQVPIESIDSVSFDVSFNSLSNSLVTY